MCPFYFSSRLESVYRIWVKDRSGGFESDISDQLRRELQTALGTAKWQVDISFFPINLLVFCLEHLMLLSSNFNLSILILFREKLEEFERAVKCSYAKCSLGDSHVERHSQFVAALQNQIGRVEKSLGDTLKEEGKQPLRWVQLDDEERDDLATFLSTGSRKLKSKIDTSITNDDSALLKPKPKNVKGFKETLMGSDAGEFSKRIDQTNRTLSLPDITSWKIMISNELDVNTIEKKSLENRAVPRSRASNMYTLMKNVGKTTQLKWLMNLFRKEKSGEHLYYVDRGVSSYLALKKKISWLTQVSLVISRLLFL